MMLSLILNGTKSKVFTCSKQRSMVQTSMFNFRKLSANQQAQQIETNNQDKNEQIMPKFKKIKIKPLYHRKYENHAPLMFEWSKDIISGKTTLASLMESNKFQEISNSICDTTRHSDKNILNIIKSLIIMNMDPSTRIVKFLEDELMLKIENNYNFDLLVSAYNIYYNIKDTSPKREKIIESLNRKINENLDSSTATLSDLLQLVKLSKHLTPEILIKIDEQITQILDSNNNISLDQLCYLLVLLSRFNRRNKSLIRSVVAKLLKYRPEEVYSMPPHLINMISSLNRLNFPEINLLEKCSDILVGLNFLENMTDSAKRDFIVAVSNFNFSYPKLLDYYLQTLLDKPELFKHQDLVTLTITLARLNYQNEEIIGIIQKHIISQCKQEDCVSRYQWFNFVYSLALLRCASVEHVRSILSTDFYKKMEQDEIDHYLNNRLKNKSKPVNSVDEVESSNSESNSANITEPQSGQEVYNVMNIRRKYSTLYGLILVELHNATSNQWNISSLEQLFESTSEQEHFQKFVQTFDLDMIKCSKDLQNFRYKFLKSLESFAPSKEQYMTVNVKTPFGFAIDAELKVDMEGKAQKITDAGVLFKDPISSIKGNNSVTDEENPDAFKRIALMCIGFNDTLLDSSSSLIGPKEAEIRILRSLGYVVVPVHQNSLPASVTSLNRVKFLQNLIVSHLKNDDTDNVQYNN